VAPEIQLPPPKKSTLHAQLVPVMIPLLHVAAVWRHKDGRWVRRKGRDGGTDVADDVLAAEARTLVWPGGGTYGGGGGTYGVGGGAGAGRPPPVEYVNVICRWSQLLSPLTAARNSQFRFLDGRLLRLSPSPNSTVSLPFVAPCDVRDMLTKIVKTNFVVVKMT
jgi:hypothetical protein